MLGYHYLNQLQIDSAENRQKVSYAYKLMFYYTCILMVIFSLVAALIPSSYYPDKIERADGTMEDISKKQTIISPSNFCVLVLKFDTNLATGCRKVLGCREGRPRNYR